MATTKTATDITIGDTIIVQSYSGRRRAMYVETIRPSATGASLVFTGSKARIRDGVRLQMFDTTLIGNHARVEVL